MTDTCVHENTRLCGGRETSPQYVQMIVCLTHRRLKPVADGEPTEVGFTRFQGLQVVLHNRRGQPQQTESSFATMGCLATLDWLFSAVVREDL